VGGDQALAGPQGGGQGFAVGAAVGAGDAGVELTQGRDDAAVDVGVAVQVDARDAERAPGGVVLRVVVGAGDRRLAGALEVGVLAGEEAAVRVLHGAEDVAALQVGGAAPAGLAGAAMGACEGLERAGLDGADLLEVRLVPGAADRVLVHAAPHGVDELELGGDGGEGARLPLGPREDLGAQQRELVEGGERVLLFATPAAELVVVERRRAGPRRRGAGPRGRCCGRRERGRGGDLAACRRAGRRRARAGGRRTRQGPGSRAARARGGRRW
jgi:hypothetical protein